MHTNYNFHYQLNIQFKKHVTVNDADEYSFVIDFIYQFILAPRFRKSRCQDKIQLYTHFTLNTNEIAIEIRYETIYYYL